LRPPALHQRLAGRNSLFDLTEFGRTTPRSASRPRGGGTYRDDRAFLVYSQRLDP
jgi:hypothetical protein